MATGSSTRSMQFRSKLIRDAGASPAILELLEASTTPENEVLFVDALLPLIPAAVHQNINRATLARDFFAWCKHPGVNCPLKLQEALDKCIKHKNAHRQLKRTFIQNVRLNWEPDQRQEYLTSIPTTKVTTFSEPYPPLGHWVYESSSIRNKWEYQITEAPQPDKRKKRYPMLELDPKKLAHDIDADTSMIFSDEADKLVGLVFRNFCPDDDAISWLDDVIEKAVSKRKSIRVRLH